MSVLEKLSLQDRAMFSSYVREYGPNSDNSDEDDCYYELTRPLSERAPIDFILRFWNMNKSYFLEKVFGDQLILRKRIEYEKPKEEIDFDQLYYHPMTEKLIDKCLNKQPHSIWTTQMLHKNQDNEDEMPEDFIYEYEADGSWYNTIDRCGWYCTHLRDMAHNTDWQYTNIYDGPTFSLKRRDKDKTIKIVNGMKYSKALGKICRYLDIPEEEYEDWRKIHSLLINEKLISGYMCLSIHPMDYVTMSDASFTSCMNWMEGGAYRRGTVEMMNSDKVVVAYLESDNETLKWWDTEEGCNQQWNFKKWRTLLIGTSDYVCSVKAYPYENKELTCIAVDMLTEAIESAYGNTYGKFYDFCNSDFYTLKYEHPENKNIDSYRVEGAITFITGGAMYCDFGTTDHFIRLSSEMDRTIHHYCDYSGQSECMFCGAVGDKSDFTNESCVFCLDCQKSRSEDEYVYCCECGDEVLLEDAIFVDGGGCFCSACARYIVRSCVRCGTSLEINNLYPVVPVYRDINKDAVFGEEELNIAMSNNYFMNGCCASCFKLIERMKQPEESLNTMTWLKPEFVARDFGVASMDDIIIKESSDGGKIVVAEVKPEDIYNMNTIAYLSNDSSPRALTDTLVNIQEAIDSDKSPDYKEKSWQEIMDTIEEDWENASAKEKKIPLWEV